MKPPTYVPHENHAKQATFTEHFAWKHEKENYRKTHLNANIRDSQEGTRKIITARHDKANCHTKVSAARLEIKKYVNRDNIKYYRRLVPTRTPTTGSSRRNPEIIFNQPTTVIPTSELQKTQTRKHIT